MSTDTSKLLTESSLKSLLETYKNFDLIELRKFSIANPRKRVEIEIVFKIWFLDDQFVINSPRLSPTGTFNETLEVVQYFGRMITKLKVDYRLLDVYQCEALNKYLNEYCSESLLDVELVHCDDDKIVHLRGPFKFVENVHLHTGNLRTNTSRFDEIFPTLCRLDLGEMYYTRTGCFEGHFPHLENLTMEFWYGLYPYTVKLLEKRLRLNPQLKHLTISRCSWDILKMCSEYLPKLESLTLEQFHDDSDFQGQDIHFDSVKVFKFKPRSAFRRNIGRLPIVFGNLEEIEFHDSPNEWIEIMQTNNELKIVTTGPLNHIQFTNILRSAPNIQELYTGYNALSPSDNVVRFMREAKHLKKLFFTAFNDRTLNQIHEKKDRNWKFLPNGALIKI